MRRKMQETAYDMIDHVMDGQLPSDAIAERGAARPQRQTAAMKQRRRRPNPRLSRLAKKRYQKNKAKYKRGLQKFNRSSAGKQFHKKLGKLAGRLRSGAPEMCNDLLDSLQLDLMQHIDTSFSTEGKNEDLLDLLSVISELDMRDEEDCYEVIEDLAEMDLLDVPDLIQSVLRGKLPRQAISELES